MKHARIEGEDLIDRYVLRRLSPAEEADFEEHYLGCQACQSELERSHEAIELVRRACALNRRQPQRMPPGRRGLVPSPAWALAAALAAAAVFVSVGWPLRSRRQESAPVLRLESYRSGPERADIGTAIRRFVLQLDLRGLPEYRTYAVDVVEDSGVTALSKENLPRTTDGALDVLVENHSLRPGAYWVRLSGINDQKERRPLREYGLRVH